MSSEVARVLRDAADLIEPPGRWTQGVGARDDSGNPVPSLSPSAVCWCGAGAIRRVAPNWPIGSDAMDAWATSVGEYLMGVWNDQQASAGPVVASLRAAADEAERSDA